MEYCIIIPTFNNEKTLEWVISEVLKITKDIFIVNDGSTDSTSVLLDKYNYLEIITYAPNRGKGYAIQKGFDAALKAGFRYAVTIDSDGQHYPSDLGLFIDKIKEEPGALIVGARSLPETISKGSSFANRFSNFWYRFLTGITLTDTQTGFRLYSLESLKSMKFFTRKYEFELEVLVRAAWHGTKIVSVPIHVFYPLKSERVSHFRPFKDFFRITLLNIVLVFIALLYIKPCSFLKNFKKENIKEFINNNILLTKESNLKIALAVSLGIFTGILPIWGFQLITAIALSQLFGLSKFITSIAANISIPPMIPLILYLSYLSGGYFIGAATNLEFSSSLSIKSFENNLLQYIVGSIVFAIILSIFAGVISFIILHLFRRRRKVTD